VPEENCEQNFTWFNVLFPKHPTHCAAFILHNNNCRSLRKHCWYEKCTSHIRLQQGGKYGPRCKRKYIHYTSVYTRIVNILALAESWQSNEAQDIYIFSRHVCDFVFVNGADLVTNILIIIEEVITAQSHNFPILKANEDHRYTLPNLYVYSLLKIILN
jgi:hypothetical protein